MRKQTQLIQINPDQFLPIPDPTSEKNTKSIGKKKVLEKQFTTGKRKLLV